MSDLEIRHETRQTIYLDKCRTCLYAGGESGYFTCLHLMLTGRPRKREVMPRDLRRYMAANGGKMPPPNCQSWEPFDKRRYDRLIRRLSDPHEPEEKKTGKGLPLRRRRKRRPT